MKKATNPGPAIRLILLLVKDGFVAVPEEPGLGVELDEAVVEQHLV